MTPEQIFSIANAVALGGWVLLILTFLFGPVGLLLYFSLRLIKGGNLRADPV